ncbi:hypothetical protein EVAR_6365_1 [Eumeta japonica]|uniref:Uncharacterized protein n=1 Tax=Eumeta variegata TaxID=151549 RepID=A0A4C1TDJ2_EUMVA|nr:hypothetical protein EVAR_6365_1 [Eumeta japonica]
MKSRVRPLHCPKRRYLLTIVFVRSLDRAAVGGRALKHADETKNAVAVGGGKKRPVRDIAVEKVLRSRRRRRDRGVTSWTTTVGRCRRENIVSRKSTNGSFQSYDTLSIE